MVSLPLSERDARPALSTECTLSNLGDRGRPLTCEGNLKLGSIPREYANASLVQRHDSEFVPREIRVRILWEALCASGPLGWTLP